MTIQQALTYLSPTPITVLHSPPILPSASTQPSPPYKPRNSRPQIPWTRPSCR